jgi:two-component system, OmpR family, phosphate regulon response regulator PhoB
MNDDTPKILIVDDEQDVTELVAYHLRVKGWKVETLSDPTRILEVSRLFSPDLMILDVMMPGIDGLQICRMFKADPVFCLVPIILLTARAEEEDRVRGFEIGADDYVCKPFSPRELTLRVQGLLRRKEDRVPVEETKRVTVGPVTLSEELHEVTVEGIPVELTPIEFRLLSLLMERKGRVQTREQLLVNVWDHDEDMETRTVDTHIRRLREKLGTAADMIETVRGVGYRLAFVR